MYKLNEIKELIKLVDSTSIQQLDIEIESGKISIRKADAGAAQFVAAQPAAAPVQPAFVPAPAAPQAPAAAVAASAEADAKADLHQITSPMVGTFYSAPSPGAPSFVKVGDIVNEKTVVCIVEAMKLMNEIEAEVNGQIVEVLVENGQLVEYGQPLFLVKR
ncbi:acetyl-CoA carboxylase biotin carboxyl carrier protein [Paenibacillus sp.]|uniref:acetyl-CoA carboxylase biotin carboxyl carrier protein n=1 Tax=Paenibacillus sp. TaxID=58172 RepID=UPI002D4D0F92|nr:acetyl-CoA carboxylase biotin carboxyl carrier protein [Paenibacillus sp.]HZG85122.1 acetyl-CoA carboxylase biotin carboxyl carrier protein [Paenibacillus sp.]